MSKSETFFLPFRVQSLAHFFPRRLRFFSILWLNIDGKNLRKLLLNIFIITLTNETSGWAICDSTFVHRRVNFCEKFRLLIC